MALHILAGGAGASPAARLRALLRTEKTDLWVAVVYSVAIALLTLVVPIATQSLVNTVAFGTVRQPLIVLTLIVLAALGFSAVLQALRTYVVELIQRRVFVRLAGTVAHRLLGAEPAAFDDHHGPELVNRFFDVVTVQKSTSILVLDGLSIAMQIAMGMLLLGIYHPYLLAFDALLVVSLVIIVFGLGRGAVRTSIAESRAKYALVAWLEEIASSLITFKSARGQRYGLQRVNALTTEYLTERRRHFRILLRQISGSLALQAIASSLLLGIGGWLVIQRQLTLGQLVAAELVVSLVVGNIAKFGKQYETYYDLLAAIDKLGYLTDLPPEGEGQERLPERDAPATLRLDRVTFAYPGRPPVLNGASLTIHAGERMAITGGSGQGRSTLLDVLYGLRTPQTGVAEMDGVDYRSLTRQNLRQHAALVRHQEIFAGTVTENVRVGDPHLTPAEVRRALAQVGLLDLVLTLPHGMETELATGGRPLTPGQSMALVLARAMASAPRLLLLDECLDHLDDSPERGRLLEVLFDVDAPWTLVVVTDDPEVIHRCDHVLQMQHGQLSGAAARSHV